MLGWLEDPLGGEPGGNRPQSPAGHLLNLYWYDATNMTSILRLSYEISVQDRYLVGVQIFEVPKEARFRFYGNRIAKNGDRAVRKLIVSVKTPSEALDEFVRVCKSVQERKVRGVHRELAFDSRKAFDRFVSNLLIVSQIAALKPKSVYELAKTTGMDISNLNKVVIFLEEVGVIRVKKSITNGRPIKTPIVDYDLIEFRL